MIVLATGFDAVDGNYTKIDMRGRGGVTMSQKWKEGPQGYLGMMEADFPNLFMILGPNGPFTNLPPSIETQVEWISDTIAKLEREGRKTVEPTQAAVDEWVATCRSIADMTLFPQAQSWIFGANIPGKKNAVMFYMAGTRQLIETAGCREGHELRDLDVRPRGCDGLIGRLSRGAAIMRSHPCRSLSGKIPAPSGVGRKRDAPHAR